jgi:two-component system response regulator NreC
VVNGSNKIRVAVIDDHGLFREGMCAMLNFYDDIEVVGETGDGTEAINKLQQLAPDVALIDIVMPNMNGLEVCRRLKKIAPNIKVIILTQYVNKEYLVTAVKIGAAGYVPKKAVASDLVLAIHVVYGGDFFLHPAVAKILVGDYRNLIESDKDEFDSLTNREREILQLVAEGNTSRKIGDLLHISEKTVIGHRASLMEKLNIHNRADLVKYAIGKGLINIENPTVMPDKNKKHTPLI